MCWLMMHRMPGTRFRVVGELDLQGAISELDLHGAIGELDLSGAIGELRSGALGQWWPL